MIQIFRTLILSIPVNYVLDIVNGVLNIYDESSTVEIAIGVAMMLNIILVPMILNFITLLLPRYRIVTDRVPFKLGPDILETFKGLIFLSVGEYFRALGPDSTVSGLQHVLEKMFPPTPALVFTHIIACVFASVIAVVEEVYISGCYVYALVRLDKRQFRRISEPGTKNFNALHSLDRKAASKVLKAKFMQNQLRVRRAALENSVQLVLMLALLAHKLYWPTLDEFDVADDADKFRISRYAFFGML